MIRNLSGGGVLYGDSVRCFVMREQFVGRDRRESLAFLLFMRRNDNIAKIRKPQTRLKRTQFALRFYRKDEGNCM